MADTIDTIDAGAAPLACRCAIKSNIVDTEAGSCEDKPSEALNKTNLFQDRS